MKARLIKALLEQPQPRSEDYGLLWRIVDVLKQPYIARKDMTSVSNIKRQLGELFAQSIDYPEDQLLELLQIRLNDFVQVNYEVALQTFLQERCKSVLQVWAEQQNLVECPDVLYADGKRYPKRYLQDEDLHAYVEKLTSSGLTVPASMIEGMLRRLSPSERYLLSQCFYEASKLNTDLICPD